LIGAEALLHLLNLDTYFTTPGRFTIPLNVSLRRMRCRTIMIPDERAAGHAADGYARASGKPAGLVVSAGPGALNSALPAATAFRDYTPMVVVAGDLPTYSKGSLAVEEVDLEGVFKPICKSYLKIREASDVALARSLIKEALKPPSKPVFVEFPLDIQEESVDYSSLEGAKPTSISAPSSLEGLSEVVKLLESSKRPLILVGGGCAHSHSIIAEFSVKHRIPLVYTLMGWCRVESKPPTSLGFCGVRGFKSANEALLKCDFLLALGARLSEATLAYGLNSRAVVVQVLVEEPFSSKAHLKLKCTCEEFTSALVETYSGGAKELWAKRAEEPTYTSKSFRILKRLFDLSVGGVLSLDMGDSSMWALEACKHGWRGLMLYPGGLATMGFSIPAALGAKLADPSRTVVAVTGDGGAIMNLPALHAISRLKPSIAVFVFNNRSYGMVQGKQIRDYGATADVELGFEGFKELSEALKMSYVKVEEEVDVDKALRALEAGPVLAEVDVEIGDRPPTPKRLFQAERS